MTAKTANEVAKMFAREWSGEPTWGPVSTAIWHAVRAAIEYDRHTRTTDSREG